MDLRQLKTFQVVATTLSFTQAAVALGYVQSSVTAQIQSLERDLGVHLFDRLGKKIKLTDAGERLLRYADQLLALAEEARTAVAGGEGVAGSLTISAPETICTYRLPPVLQEYRRRYPHVQVVFKPSPVADLRRLVAEGALDVAFVLETPVGAPGLNVRPLVKEEVLVVAPANHHLAGVDEVRAADLAGETILFTGLGCCYRNLFERALIAGGVYPSTALQFESVEAIKQCVITGMGIAALPAVAVAKELTEGKLASLRWADQPLSVVTQMVWHKDKWPSPAFQALVLLVEEVFHQFC
ncbi:MAG: LysR family transcriptional regulator [Bacillota bacterium]